MFDSNGLPQLNQDAFSLVHDILYCRCMKEICQKVACSAVEDPQNEFECYRARKTNDLQ